MVRLTLTGAGYAVVEAVDGEDALQKAMARKYDAILTDQNMPRLDGLSFIRKYRASSASVGVPIVFLSTESREDLKKQARDAGAIGWMMKPFDQAQLLAVVKKVAGA
jgi:two-component system chemotaxis response regulator CheY